MLLLPQASHSIRNAHHGALKRPILAMPSSRSITTSAYLGSHENPLGLPRKGTPPNLAARMQRGLPEKRKIKDVKKVVAVSSAKGGVGKSTIAANLALAFARQGHRTGILDTDIFGPSIPTLFNLTTDPTTGETPEPRLSESTNRLLPLTNYGVRTMSMGYLVPPSKAVVWRGLMVMKALQQLLHEVEWGGLDVLVLDLPPGTGDTQLTVAQQVVIDGAVLVSTPQQLSLADTMRGLRMWREVGVPVLGMVQNMSVFVCPGCGGRHHLFGEGGVRRACEREGLELLADVPVDGGVCRDADRGVPSVVGEPEGASARVFLEMAERIGGMVGL